LRCAAASAAAAARAEVIATYDAATVLVTVTSQVALRPSRYGIDIVDIPIQMSKYIK